MIKYFPVSALSDKDKKIIIKKFPLAGTPAEADYTGDGTVFLVVVQGRPVKMFYPLKNKEGTPELPEEFFVNIHPEAEGLTNIYLGRVSGGVFFAMRRLEEKEKSSVTDEYMSVSSAAQIIGVTRAHLSHLCAKGRVPGAQRIGRFYLVPREWVAARVLARIGSVTRAEAARRLGVSRQYVGQLVQSGKLETADDGRVILDSLARLMAERDGK